jgi:hypothetical protein
MKISSALLRALYVNEVEVSDALCFLGESVTKALSCEANLPAGRTRQGGKKQLVDCWLVRGYYPDTTVMFKITIWRSSSFMSSNFTFKPEYSANVTLACPKAKTPHYFFDSSFIESLAMEKAIDQNLFEVDELSHDKSNFLPKVRKPRCAAPKGMVPLNLKQKKVKRKNAV